MSAPDLTLRVVMVSSNITDDIGDGLELNAEPTVILQGSAEAVKAAAKLFGEQVTIAALPAVTVGVPTVQRYYYDITQDEFVEDATGDWVSYAEILVALTPTAVDASQPADPAVNAPKMRPETVSENIARDMREGRFPERSEPQMVPVEPAAPDPDETTAEENVGILSARVESLLAENALLRRQFAMGKAAPDTAAIREALFSLPAVYAHQINTGVREVYDPLQRFYTMESVLAALIAKGTAE